MRMMCQLHVNMTIAGNTAYAVWYRHCMSAWHGSAPDLCCSTQTQLEDCKVGGEATRTVLLCLADIGVSKASKQLAMQV